MKTTTFLALSPLAPLFLGLSPALSAAAGFASLRVSEAAGLEPLVSLEPALPIAPTMPIRTKRATRPRQPKPTILPALDFFGGWGWNGGTP
ncbi:hypothetical protein [Streptomyces sp. TP-A0356]|uniref:hypothetical protein n=1 Tax=Streptomyces sp. TP-A0356 TaxID=1359208 RepID=UPI00131C9FA6|nr:hypothetical protein [Streptomyces sp. TP-A0356]